MPPPSVLREVDEHVPRWVLIGSYARDYWVHAVAGLPLVAQTLDVDVTVLVTSMRHYRDLLSELNGPSGTGIVFDIEGHQVDVIPHGALAENGIVETRPGVTMDVSGMAESVEHGVEVAMGDIVGRVPTLASMIGLKAVAWGYRHSTTGKDARDLGPLLDATYSGPFADEVWADDGACASWDYDPQLVGPYRAGLKLHDTWEPRSLARLDEYLSPQGRIELAARIARDGRGGQAHQRFEQVSALMAGVAGLLREQQPAR